MFKHVNYELETPQDENQKRDLKERGYLLETDATFILDNNLSAIEISRYTDGWYSCFPYIEIYHSFDKTMIKEQCLEIIHTALYAKTSSLKSTGNWYKCADTMLALLDWCEADLDWDVIFCIFTKYINLSISLRYTEAQRKTDLNITVFTNTR